MAKTVSCCCNILWFIFGGFFSFISWIMAGLIFCISIIGVPFGFQFFKIAKLALTPFGYEIVDEDELNNRIIETTPIIIKNNNNNINNFNIQTNQNLVNQTNQNFVNQTNQNFVTQTNQNFVTQTNQNFATQNY